MTQKEIQILRMIADRYGIFIAVSATRYAHRPEVLAGIMMRESHGGELLKDGKGDSGHGHGLMQIDDRSYPEFCSSPDWRDPASNINQGAKVLAEKRDYLSSRIHIPPCDLERASIAAYNSGGRMVAQAWLAGQDLDIYTSGKDFSRAVLQYADAYREIVEADRPPALAPEPQPDGPWTALYKALMRALGRQ